MHSKNIKPIRSAKRYFWHRFKLPKEFVDAYRDRKVDFGFNGLGEIAYLRTYSRVMENGTNEQWPDTVERIVNGWFRIMHEFTTNRFDRDRRMVDAMRMYDKIFWFKFLPPGRGIWAMGSKLTEEKKLYTALNNWAFVSTGISKKQKKSDPFVFLMDSSMLGVGVGFDTKGANLIRIYKPNKFLTQAHEIADTREGWVESVKLLLDSYFEQGKNNIAFNYSKIRPKGKPLLTFGGVASGPEPLIELHNLLRK